MSSGARIIPTLVVGRATARVETALRPRTRVLPVIRRDTLLSAAFLTAAVLAGHIWCLRDGLFLDDHWHQAHLRNSGWSLAQLVSVTTIAPDTFLHCWWQEKSNCWEYVRPISVVFMKIMQIVTGGSLAGQHAVNVLLHLATTLMVWQLCLKMTGHRGWSVVGGFLFGLYTHSMIPVAWLASQNAILQTALTVAGMLVYARASGLNLAAAPDSREDEQFVPQLRMPAFAWVCVLMALGMLTRENAVVTPVFAWAFDRAFGGRAHARARRSAHLFLILLAGAFMAWRLTYATFPVPDFYLRRPDGPTYPLWLLAKIMHYLCSAVWLTPMTVGPTGRFNPFSEVPWDCALMAAILGTMSFGYWCACRQIRGWWIWPLWILLAILPVAPILATPHTGYMAGVGFAIAMAIGPALRQRVRPLGIGRWSPAVACWFIFATLVYVPITRVLWNGMRAAENTTMEAVAATPPSSTARDVYFINLPFVNVYAPVQLQELCGSSTADKCYHVLSYAPELLRMEQTSRIEQIDEHRFSVTVGGTGFFSGALGRYLIEGMRPDSGQLKVGQVIKDPDGEFEVQVAQANDEGIHKLIFSFRRPLASEAYSFYATTMHADATPVRFAAASSGTLAARDVTPEAVVDSTSRAGMSSSAQLHRDIDWLYAVRAAVAKGIKTDLYFTGPPFPGPRR